MVLWGLLIIFSELNPDRVFEAAEAAGFEPTGELVQLNSYENRVFDLKLEDSSRVIAKFYRPGRWSADSILEEHEFLLELQDEDLPAGAPLVFPDNKLTSFGYTQSLFLLDDIYVAFFDKIRGRLPQELFLDDYFQIGILLAKIHNVGAQKTAEHRPWLDSSFPGGWSTLDFLDSWVAPEVQSRYFKAAETILYKLEEQVDSSEFIRIHGDCHRGNLIFNPIPSGADKEASLLGQPQISSKTGNFSILDFDDFCNGPVVQDFWMLLSETEDQENNSEREKLLLGYEEIREFPHHQWEWIPLLRGLRVISYAGWIARRWEDPSFPRIFPEFNSYTYWAEETEALERIAWQIK